MIQFINKYKIVILILGVFTSCNPDLAEENPNNIDSSSFWKTLDDTEKGLSSTYATLYSPNILAIREESLHSDESYYGSNRPSNPTPGQASLDPGVYWKQNIADVSGHGLPQRHWDACYRGIFRANQVIGALERMSNQTSSRWIQQMAQARFLRGLYHFYLHSSFDFGKIIIRDKVPVTLEDLYKPRSTSSEVMTFFREDLQYAYDNLNPKTASTVEKGRATKGAAATILGTSYLYEASENGVVASYAKASDLFNYVITSGSYSLEQDLTKMFTTAGEFNSESILEVNLDVNLIPNLLAFDEEAPTTRMPFLTFNAGQSFTPSAWLSLAYRTEPMDPKDARNYIAGVVDELNFATKKKSVPLRASAKVGLLEDIHTRVYGQPNVVNNTGQNGGTNTKNIFQNTSTTNQARSLGFYKTYANHDLITNDFNNQVAQRSSKNITITRLSEVYLMQAECYIKANNVTKALELINAIRARWGLVLLGPSVAPFSGSRTFNGLSYTPASLMAHLMDIGKPLELSVEGHAVRFIDLRRWGRLKSRFQELADKTYYTLDFSFTNTTVTPNKVDVFRNASVVDVRRTTGIPANNADVIDYEFDDQAANFKVGKSEYLAIPDSEVTTNPNFYNNVK